MTTSMTKPQMARLLKEADAAGKAAAKAMTPTPMRVVERANPLNDNSRIVRDYGVYADGVCGFASVSVHPGGSRFARYLKNLPNSRWRTDHYAGGVSMSVFDYRQSMQLKEAYASAFAGVLRAAGIKAYSQSRMD